MSSDEKGVKVKVVELQNLFNFIVDIFYLKSSRLSKTAFEFFKFKVRILQTTSDGKMYQNKTCRTSKIIQLCS